MDKAENDGSTPLSIAAQTGHLEVTRMDKAENDGATPLSIAAHQGQLEVVPPLCPLQRARTVARRFAMAVPCSRRPRAVWEHLAGGRQRPIPEDLSRCIPC